MLRVPSVDETVTYWKNKGGILDRAKYKPGTSNGNAELMSAFVRLGYHHPHHPDHHRRRRRANNREEQQQSLSPKEKEEEEEEEVEDQHDGFSLELVVSPKKDDTFQLGNVISYIGVSMLLQYKDNLLLKKAVTGEEKPIMDQGMEPNGIPVRSSASAPGDYLSRLALTSRNLTATQNFYTSMLGMSIKAKDQTMVCLRFDDHPIQEGTEQGQGGRIGGVPITLVFEATEEELKLGDCFDHIVVATSADIMEQYERIKRCNGTIFMKPTEMFGKQVMGVMDPNGYKVILASR